MSPQDIGAGRHLVIGLLVLALLMMTAPAAAAGGGGGMIRLDHPKALAWLPPRVADADRDRARLAALALTGADPTAAGTVHPDGSVVYVVAGDLRGGRGLLQVTTAHPDRPQVLARVPLSPGLVPRDLVVDADRARLYLASGTHTLVLDIARPALPVVIGRIADVMIAAHDRLELHPIADPTFGWRTLLSVRTDFAGGEGCRPGALHVIDISGRLQDAPIEVVRTTAPTDPTGQVCPEPVLRLDAAARRIAVDWTGGGTTVRTDLAPYDITAAFQATATLCRLVQV